MKLWQILMLIDDVRILDNELKDIIKRGATNNVSNSKVFKELFDTVTAFRNEGHSVNYDMIIKRFSDVYGLDFPVNYMDDLIKASYDFIDGNIYSLIDVYSKDYQRLINEALNLSKLGMSHDEIVSKAMKNIHPGKVLDSAGRKQSIETIIRRDLRYASAELAEKMANDVASEIGSTYFYIPDHSGAGIDHEPLQDKYYGTPVGTFVDDFGDKITIHDESILSSIDRPMFTGWGCRHMKIPQLAGLKVAKSFDPLKEFDKLEKI